MNNKEKIQFLASQEYLETLKQYNLDYQNYNLLFFVHFACLLFSTSGISKFHLNLDYSYHYFDPPTNNTNNKATEGLTFDKTRMSLFSTNNSLIELSRRCSNQNNSFRNKFFSIRGNRNLRDFIQSYLQKNLIFNQLTYEEFRNTPFKTLLIDFTIKNRNSLDTQQQFLNLIEKQCPEVNYFCHYIQMTKNTDTIKNPTIKYKI